VRIHTLASRLADLPRDFWDSRESELLALSRWVDTDRPDLKALSKKFPSTQRIVWIATSGTLSGAQGTSWIGLSKEALLANALSVLRHLKVTPQERWGLALPLAHVGGLGIHARAFLQSTTKDHTQLIDELMPARWDAKALARTRVQHLSLVPTQLFDLAHLNLRAPASLRTLVVGGDRLDPVLLQKAQALGWPVLPSFGMSECGSQLATATPENPALQLLDHAQVKIDADRRLHLKSPALFRYHLRLTDTGLQLTERTEAWWASNDRAELKGRELTILGRLDQLIKVRGERVDLTALEARLQQLAGTELVLIALPDERDGAQLWAVSEAALGLEEINRALLPHQKLKGLKTIPQLPRTALGKVQRATLSDWLKQNLAAK